MRKISAEELNACLVEHCDWLTSEGVRGKQAKFKDCNFSGLDHRFADLKGAILIDADLQGVSLRWADLRFADLRFVNLRSADLRDSKLVGAYLQNSDLRCAKLDKCISHTGSIHGAHFTSDALPWLMLRPNWVKEKARVHIHEE
jgi:uncharacterized protein YjbI with pentapeptide repeats